MTLSDLGSIANLLSAAAVLATLIYLSRQVKQGNMLARAQARQRMVEQANQELYVWMNDPPLRESFAKPAPLTREEQGKVHYFLLCARRAREWEWFQFRDGVVKEDVYRAYHEVIALHLGVPRTRHWWSTVGRIGFNPEFVVEVDAFLADKPFLTYFEDILSFDVPPSAAARPALESGPAA
jgi:hypothetical protein